MTDNLPEVAAPRLPVQNSMFFDVAKFEHAQRVAKMIATSTMIPEHFRDNLGNCIIALNYAERIQADPFMVMQNMCVIHGKPGIEGKLVIALLNSSGRFEPVQFRETGNLKKPVKDDDGCLAYSKDLRSGTVLEGPMVDWEMVKAEGWYGKQGSKWKTMPALMFRYRAATYFARVYCPEVLLGMQTREEIQDVVAMEKDSEGVYGAAAAVVTPAKTKAIYQPQTPSEAPGGTTTPAEGSNNAGEGEKTPPEPPREAWDPLTAQVQQKYRIEGQREAIMAACAERGVDTKGMLPRDAHAKLLEFEADRKRQEEAEALKAADLIPEVTEEEVDAYVADQEPPPDGPKWPVTFVTMELAGTPDGEKIAALARLFPTPLKVIAKACEISLPLVTLGACRHIAAKMEAKGGFALKAATPSQEDPF